LLSANGVPSSNLLRRILADLAVAAPMITTEIVAMHLAGTTLPSRIPGVDLDETFETSVSEDKASIIKRQKSSDRSLKSTPATSTTGSHKDPFHLPDYMAYLENQEERMEMYGKQT
jgi:hypothetical protein